MISDTRWLLPDGIDELLPERAAAVERLRRALLDDCERWGYRLVMPPLVEFTDSLLVGLGADLDQVTCKFSDRASGRTLGVRADITPQVARIDAHSLNETGITRLCYAGSTLKSVSDSALSGRSPVQLGAELYGSQDLAADREVIGLMLSLLDRAGLAEGHLPVTLDLGHVGVYQALVAAFTPDADLEEQIFDALQRKSAPDLQAITQALPPAFGQALQALLALHGGADVLPQAAQALGQIPGVSEALNRVQEVVNAVRASFPDVDVYIDLAELRGFRYHTGLVFAAYVEGVGAALAKGGRYDNVGDVFGRNRPATGFAFDLKVLIDCLAVKHNGPVCISAPLLEDEALAIAVAQLREQGHVVVVAIGDEHDPRCSEQLVCRDGAWVLETIAQREPS